MSNYEIAEIVAETINSWGGERVKVNSTHKGVGISFENPASGISPVVYIEDGDKEDTNEAAVRIARMLAEHANPNIDTEALLSEIQNWETVKAKIFARFIHPVEPLKEDTVSFSAYSFLDSDVRVVIGIGVDDAIINVTTEMTKCWKKQPEEVLSVALANTVAQTECQTLFGIIVEMIGEEQAEKMCPQEPIEDMYVVTNTRRHCGAGILLAPEALRKLISPLYGEEDVAIIPSSVHEILVCRTNGNISLTELTDMCRDVNRTQVDLPDILGWEAMLLRGNELIPASMA